MSQVRAGKSCTPCRSGRFVLTRRTRTVTLSTLAVATLAAGLSACSSGAGSATVAVFSPVRPVSASALAADAAILTKRLHVMGESSDTASVHGTQVMVTGGRLKVPATDLGEIGHFYIRPVLCGAPAFSPSLMGESVSPGSLPTCQAQYATTASNLATTPDANAVEGYTASSIPPDPAFAHYPSSKSDNPNATVLLPGDPAAGSQQYPRFVLGKAAPGALAVASASALFDTSVNQWAVMYTLTRSGSRAWDEAAQASFHQYIAVDLDGLVESAPIIQPTSFAFASFEGRGEISGNFRAAYAKTLAALLASGPLAAPLRLSANQ